MKDSVYLLVLSVALTQSSVTLAFPAQEDLRGLQCHFPSAKEMVTFTLTPLLKDHIKNNESVVYQVTLSRALYLGEETSTTFIVSATKDTASAQVYTLSGEAGNYTSFELTLAKGAVLKSFDLPSMFFASLAMVFLDGSDDSKRVDKEPVCMPI